jgi:acyl carrier protein
MAPRDQVIDLLVETYGVDRSAVRDEATLHDLGLDSLSVAELLFDIEELFDMEIPADRLDITTFGDAVALIERGAGGDGA